MPATGLKPPGKVFAIGDVHGCADELAELLKKIAPKANDTVVFLGDYIDRGPDSRGVVDHILELSKKCNVVALKGNHEAMFIDFMEAPESAGAGMFVLNGGAATLASYAGPGGSFEIPETHIKFFYELKLTFETDTHFFVHAGVPNGPLSSINASEIEHALLWSRQPFLSSTYSWEKIVVHGHTPVELQEVKPNRINVDTGCVYNGLLTAVELPSVKFYQVRKKSSSVAALVPEPTGRLAVRFTGKLPVEARTGKSPTYKFETLNYNQFGLLMQDSEVREAPAFARDDVVEGQIGTGTSAIQFKGTVVRAESRKDVRVYGIRIDRVTNGNDGREWIERPDLK